MLQAKTGRFLFVFFFASQLSANTYDKRARLGCAWDALSSASLSSVSLSETLTVLAKRFGKAFTERREQL